MDEATESYGRYRLIERIGKGGMAEVFRAYVEGFEAFRNVFVIKRIRPEKSDSAEFVEMFVQEARISALLHHPNIVEVYDFGQIGGEYFMAMEYLRGKDLSTVMRALRLAHAAVPPPVAACVAQQIALGLHHAHHARLRSGQPAEIVHRDVTPSNIMLLRSGGVKVLDFGIAKAAQMAVTSAVRKGRVKGKLAYLSPEQVRNDELDGRSDVFSLGVVLWEMLVGQRLFAGDNEFQTLRNVLLQPVPPPSSKRAGVPAALDAIAARALQRDRDRRTPSAQAMADELQAVVGDVPNAGEAVARLLLDVFGDEMTSEARQVATSSISVVSVSVPQEGRRTGAVDVGVAADVPNDDGKSWTRGPTPRDHARTRRLALAIVAAAVLVACLTWAAWVRHQREFAPRGVDALPAHATAETAAPTRKTAPSRNAMYKNFDEYPLPPAPTSRRDFSTREGRP
jgi:serine/threonine protein kinase